MNHRLIRTLLVIGAALLAGVPARSQVVVTIGPAVSPVGGRITAAFSNHWSQTVGIASTPCVMFAYDSANNLVFAPQLCPATTAQVQPGQVFVDEWLQVDFNFQPVPPGTYTVQAVTAIGTFSQVVTIGGVATATELLGTPRVGTTRQVRFDSPADAGFTYIGAAALSTGPGIPTCGGLVLLDPSDLLFQYSLAADNGIFSGFSGPLDYSGATGFGSTPFITFPNLPATAGVTFLLQFVVADLSAPCVVRRVGDLTAITIVP